MDASSARRAVRRGRNCDVRLRGQPAPAAVSVKRVDGVPLAANARAMTSESGMLTLVRTATLAAGLAWIGACTKHAVKRPTTSEPEQTAVALEPAHPSQPDLGDPRRQYLVHDEGNIVLRTLDGKAEHVLATDAANALYHPSLELVWYVREEALYVIDLRSSDFAPIRIARGITSDMGDLKVDHPNGSASDNDLCDVEFSTLRFAEPPVFDVVDENLDAPVFENAGWLVEQLRRPARELPQSPGFSSDKRRRVPRRKSACSVEPEECGAYVPFGARGTELVVVGNEQGDCYHRYCLLYDATKKLYSTPPQGEVWSAPAKLDAPECEAYRFASDGLTFFTYSQVCVSDAPCVDVSGAVLGWRVPGVVVGDT